MTPEAKKASNLASKARRKGAISEYGKRKRAAETPEERKKRLDDLKERSRVRYRNPEQKARLNAYMKARYAANREKFRAQNKAWQAANKHVARNNNRKRKHGIPPEVAQAELVAQGGVCALCTDAVSFDVPKGVGAACTDHCHATGVFRGVLCNRCNSALGFFRDRVDVLEKAAEYLRRSRGGS